MNDVIHEHGVLVRHWAHLQQSVTETVQKNGLTVASLEAEVVRLRGHLLVARTQLFWGIGGAPLTATKSHHAPAPSSPAPSSWPQVDAVLCRTGCAGHAHPWRDEQGRCTAMENPASRRRGVGECRLFARATHRRAGRCAAGKSTGVASPAGSSFRRWVESSAPVAGWNHTDVRPFGCGSSAKARRMRTGEAV